MNDKSKIKSKRKELMEMIIQILREQFVNITPNKDKISHYIDERLAGNAMN